MKTPTVKTPMARVELIQWIEGVEVHPRGEIGSVSWLEKRMKGEVGLNVGFLKVMKRIKKKKKKKISTDTLVSIPKKRSSLDAGAKLKVLTKPK